MQVRSPLPGRPGRARARRIRAPDPAGVAPELAGRGNAAAALGGHRPGGHGPQHPRRLPRVQGRLGAPDRHDHRRDALPGRGLAGVGAVRQRGHGGQGRRQPRLAVRPARPGAAPADGRRPGLLRRGPRPVPPPHGEPPHRGRRRRRTSPGPRSCCAGGSAGSTCYSPSRPTSAGSPGPTASTSPAGTSRSSSASNGCSRTSSRRSPRPRATRTAASGWPTTLWTAGRGWPGRLRAEHHPERRPQGPGPAPHDAPAGGRPGGPAPLRGLGGGAKGCP